MTSRVAGAGLACVVSLGLLAGCGGDSGGGEGGAGLPTRSPALSPTGTLPSATRTPIRSDEPTDDATEPTRDVTREPTDRVTGAPDTRTGEPADEASDGASSTSEGTSASADEGVPA